MLIAVRLGLSRAQMQSLFYAAPMHDVGKIGIPDQIILKPTRLSADEFRIMQKYTIIGSNMLSNSKAEILTIAQQIALWHHERWDGSGYPHRLSGTAIPQFCRITALADTFDALMTRRPYKEAFPVDKTCEIINGERGKHFDPDIVDVFNANRENFLKIENEVSLVKDRPMAEIIRKSTGLNISLGM